MIFDAHVHPPDLRDTESDPDGPDVQRMLARMDACGVDRSLILGAVGISQTPTPDEITLVNTHTMRLVERFPDRFSGLCYLNPSHDADFTVGEMNRCITDGNLIGVKLWVALNARDRKHDPLMKHAAKLGCMVLYHAWHKTVQRTPQESDPSDIADLARRHPDVPILMAHMMGGGVRGVSDVADCPNVKIDVSGSPPTAGTLEYALDTIGAARVCYGSDWPVRDFATQIGKVESATLSDDDREAIYWRNLHDMLGERSPC